MIHPSATDILKTIDATIEAKVIPALGDLDGRSAITTVRHLLRLVRVRIEEEGQILTDDIAELRKLLPNVAAYLRAVGTSQAEAGHIDAALVEAATDSARYPTLDHLAEEAGPDRKSTRLNSSH